MLPGRWQAFTVESEALVGNPLGDPASRPLYVWTPPAYDVSHALPALFLLHPMTGQARSFFNVAPFSPNVPERIDAAGLDAVVVIVDGWTAYGGAQWIDSPATGRYGTYLCDEVVPFVDERWHVGARGLAGFSSGGFGAMVWSMLRPDLFAGFATHAGDALFDVTLRRELGLAAQALRNLYDGSFERFWEDFSSGRHVFANRTDPLLQNVWATAAAYSPGEDGGVDLPFRVETGELVPEVWERWLAWDPVRLAPQHAYALRTLRAIWIDAGRSDEYLLDLGATAFHEAVRAAGVDDSIVRFELYDGTHRTPAWRFPASLAFLADRLAS